MNHRNGFIQYYTVNITEKDTTQAWSFFTSTTNLSITSLHPFYEYICVVAAGTSIGTGPFSPPLSIEMPEDGMNNSIIVDVPN